MAVVEPMIFSYEDIPNVRDPRGKVRPGIRLVLEHNRVTLPLVGLLDSGSDISFSFAVLGLNLGVNFHPSQLTPLSGIAVRTMWSLLKVQMAPREGVRSE